MNCQNGCTIPPEKLKYKKDFVYYCYVCHKFFLIKNSRIYTVDFPDF